MYKTVSAPHSTSYSSAMKGRSFTRSVVKIFRFCVVLVGVLLGWSVLQGHPAPARRAIVGTLSVGDMTTAVSLATAHYAGDTAFGVCTWADPDATVHQCVCDAAKTACFTSHLPLYDVPMEVQNADGEACLTVHQETGLVTYHDTGTCQRPRISRLFDASVFNVGTGVTLESVALSGWEGVPVLDGPDSDAGLFSLVIPALWQEFAADGAVTLQLTCHSLSIQDGLTLVVRVGAAVCTAPGEALAAFVPPTSGQALTCTFGALAQEVQASNVVTLTTTGCAAGKRLSLPFVSEADMTATWATTAGVITGGILTYETVGTP